MPPTSSQIETELHAVLAELLRTSGAARTTLRLDDAARGWGVDFVCAEALTQGAKSLRNEGSINQRAAETVQWLARERRNLIQPDLLNHPSPAPPPALLKFYGATAQMLGPILDGTGYLAGWISAHYTNGAHSFTDAEISALDGARARVARLIGLASG